MMNIDEMSILDKKRILIDQINDAEEELLDDMLLDLGYEFSEYDLED